MIADSPGRATVCAGNGRATPHDGWVVGFRLAWRLAAGAGAQLPRFLTLSDDLPDGLAVREHALANAADVYGAEFRLTVRGGPTIFTTLLEIEIWDPAKSPLPDGCPTTLWERGTELQARATALRRVLRLALEGGVSDGLLSDADALGLRRAADGIIADNLAH